MGEAVFSFAKRTFLGCAPHKEWRDALVRSIIRHGDYSSNAGRKEPIRVGLTVQDSKLIKRVALVYPEAAKRARVQGSVDLEITVDEQGNVTDARVISGHSMLHEEALRAVRQWKYSPTLLNGEPVPVIAPVVVYFKLST